jgi:hypothetical protein
MATAPVIPPLPVVASDLARVTAYDGLSKMYLLANQTLEARGEALCNVPVATHAHDPTLHPMLLHGG